MQGLSDYVPMTHSHPVWQLDFRWKMRQFRQRGRVLTSWQLCFRSGRYSFRPPPLPRARKRRPHAHAPIIPEGRGRGYGSGRGGKKREFQPVESWGGAPRSASSHRLWMVPGTEPLVARGEIGGPQGEGGGQCQCQSVSGVRDFQT